MRPRSIITCEGRQRVRESKAPPRRSRGFDIEAGGFDLRGEETALTAASGAPDHAPTLSSHNTVSQLLL